MSSFVGFISLYLCFMFSGLTILAENINRMRYMSHFRSIHRGAFFQEMRTSEPRQLLPEAWGEYYHLSKLVLLFLEFILDVLLPLCKHVETFY